MTVISSGRTLGKEYLVDGSSCLIKGTSICTVLMESNYLMRLMAAYLASSDNVIFSSPLSLQHRVTPIEALWFKMVSVQNGELSRTFSKLFFCCRRPIFFVTDEAAPPLAKIFDIVDLDGPSRA